MKYKTLEEQYQEKLDNPPVWLTKMIYETQCANYLIFGSGASAEC